MSTFWDSAGGKTILGHTDWPRWNVANPRCETEAMTRYVCSNSVIHRWGISLTKPPKAPEGWDTCAIVFICNLEDFEVDAICTKWALDKLWKLGLSIAFAAVPRKWIVLRGNLHVGGMQYISRAGQWTSNIRTPALFDTKYQAMLHGFARCIDDHVL